MIISTIHAKDFGAATAIALVLAMAFAPAASRAENQLALAIPAHANTLPQSADETLVDWHRDS